MKKIHCHGCKVIMDEGEELFPFTCLNPDTHKKEDMKFCESCYERRLLGIPIDGIQEKKQKKGIKIKKV